NSAVASKRKSTLARPRAMQRRDINKRLSFAEAENGQKDRNKEVEEEREPATKKGINKSGSECEGKKERERGRGESAAPGPRLSSPLSLCSTNVPIYYFRGIRPSFRIGKLLFPPCAGAGRCTRVSLSEEPPLSNHRMDFRGVFVENGMARQMRE
ncbi:hypothetical protein ALC57_08715, partial [Trachymyrmex cornetzi]